MGIATVLAASPLNGKRVLLIEHRVIKHEITLSGRHNLLGKVLPDEAWGNLLPRQIPIALVSGNPLTMVGKVGQRIVDLTDQVGTGNSPNGLQSLSSFDSSESATRCGSVALLFLRKSYILAGNYLTQRRWAQSKIMKPQQQATFIEVC